MNRQWNQISIGWSRVFLLPTTILLTPFLIFLDHFFYDWSDSSTSISLAILIGIGLICSFVMIVGGRIWHSLIVAGLLTFFIDTQFELIEGSGLSEKYVWLVIGIGWFIISWGVKENFFRILAVIFAVFFVVTFGQVMLGRVVSPKLPYDLHFEKPTLDEVGQALPRMVHLVLDEHIGIEGIPQDSALGQKMKDDLKRFYQNNGFILFGGAYSHYSLTIGSIPHLLNFSASAEDTTLSGDPLFEGTEPYRLLENQYFRLLFSQGYKINVLANSMYFDYCSKSLVMIENCAEVAFSGMKLLKDSDLALVDKLRSIFSHYFSLGYTFKGIKYAYNHLVQILSEKAIELPIWILPSPLMPLSSLQILDALTEKIATLPNGNIIYSHLMFPHQPYVIRSDCSLNPLQNEWKLNGGDYALEQKNTPVSREERYQLYYKQMECLNKKLDNLFQQMRKNGIYDDSIIILHGDHGSRIARLAASTDNLGRLSNRDFEDYFSTHFAVKLPDVKPHYFASRQPIEALLAETIFPNVAIASKKNESEPFIFLRGKEGRKSINFSLLRN